MKLSQGKWRAIFVVYCAAGAALVFLFTKGSSEVSTDFASVTGDIHQLAFQVDGRVAEVLVDDNQRVDQGDVLARLDKAPYAAKLKQAEGSLAQAQASRDAAARNLAIVRVTTAEALAAAEAAVAASKALQNLAQADLNQKSFERQQIALAIGRNRGAVSLQDEKKSITSYDAAAAEAAAAKAAVEQSESRRRQAATGPEAVVAAEQLLALAEANVDRAAAEREQAQLDLSYCTLRAPADGYVSHKNIEVGQYVPEQKPMLAVVASNRPWIVARFREPDLDRIRAGQTVTLVLDAHPNRTIQGVVESVEAGSQDSTALFPSYGMSGGTGYFSWLMQRMPVKIRVPEYKADPAAPWKVGLNASVKIDDPAPNQKFFN